MYPWITIGRRDWGEHMLLLRFFGLCFGLCFELFFEQFLGLYFGENGFGL